METNRAMAVAGRMVVRQARTHGMREGSAGQPLCIQYYIRVRVFRVRNIDGVFASRFEYDTLRVPTVYTLLCSVTLVVGL